MRVLWICNIVLNDFTKEYDIRERPLGGWIEGMFHRLVEEEDLTFGFCFPIIDECRIKSGAMDKFYYYSFHADMNKHDYNDCMKNEFVDILRSFKPDVIHIWGTEYNHSLAMIEACKILNLQDKVLVSIQGLVSFCAYHYDMGIPCEYKTIKTNGSSVADEKELFAKRGKIEQMALEQAKHITDCTEWGRMCVSIVNPRAHFYHCNELLRDVFYDAPKWYVNDCRRHSLFVSQASYPVKGIHFLLQALPIVRRFYPDLTLYVGGADILGNNVKNGYAKYLEEIINKNSLESCVCFLGYLNAEEMVQQYLKAHIFISPSTIENPSNSICEAMLLGTPTVASFVGGTPDLISNGNDGFLYPVDEHYILAAHIIRLFGDDELSMAISRNGIRRATERHDRNTVGKRMKKIYEEIHCQ